MTSLNPDYRNNREMNKYKECCEKVEKGNKYGTDELKSYMRRQKEYRRIRAVQEFEEREKMLEVKKQRLRELDSKCKQIAYKKLERKPSTNNNSPNSGHSHYCSKNPSQYLLRPQQPSQLQYPSNFGSYQSHSYSQHPGISSRSEKSRSRPKRSKYEDQDQVQESGSRTKLEREAANFIFKEFENIVKRECKNLLKNRHCLSGSTSATSIVSLPKPPAASGKASREVMKVDKNVGTSFSIYEHFPTQIPSRVIDSDSQHSEISSSIIKPVASSKGCHALVKKGRRAYEISPKVPSPPEYIKNEAASKIQAAYKSYKVRSVLSEARLISRGSRNNNNREGSSSRPTTASSAFPSADSLIPRKKPTFYKPSGVKASSSPFRPTPEDIPGYIPPPPSYKPLPRAPDLSPRTLPLRLKTVDEPFPNKQVLENLDSSQHTLSSTSSPLKLISSISKFQLPSSLLQGQGTPSSKDIASNLIRAALRNSVGKISSKDYGLTEDQKRMSPSGLNFGVDFKEDRSSLREIRIPEEKRSRPSSDAENHQSSHYVGNRGREFEGENVNLEAEYRSRNFEEHKLRIFAETKNRQLQQKLRNFEIKRAQEFEETRAAKRLEEKIARNEEDRQRIVSEENQQRILEESNRKEESRSRATDETRIRNLREGIRNIEEEICSSRSAKTKPASDLPRRIESSRKIEIPERIQIPPSVTFLTNGTSNPAFMDLPIPAFSTVLQEKLRLLREEQEVRTETAKRKSNSKSPSKRSLTAVSKATEQIKMKIVEAKQILEEYKTELLRSSSASNMSHGDDHDPTYESDFDSESVLSQSLVQQNSLFGADSEILSSLDGQLELIPRPKLDEGKKSKSGESSSRSSVRPSKDASLESYREPQVRRKSPVVLSEKVNGDASVSSEKVSRRKVIQTSVSSEVLVEEEEGEEGSDDTEYEEIAQTVSRASSNLPTEDVVYETDFDTDLQSSISKRVRSSVGASQKDFSLMVDLEDKEATQDSFSISTGTDPVDLPEEPKGQKPVLATTSKIDQGIQIPAGIVEESEKSSEISEIFKSETESLGKSMEVSEDLHKSSEVVQTSTPSPPTSSEIVKKTLRSVPKSSEIVQKTLRSLPKSSEIVQKTLRSLPKSPKISEEMQNSEEISEILEKSSRISENLQEFSQISENIQKSLEISEDQMKSSEIPEELQKSLDISMNLIESEIPEDKSLEISEKFESEVAEDLPASQFSVTLSKNLPKSEEVLSENIPKSAEASLLESVAEKIVKSEISEGIPQSMQISINLPGTVSEQPVSVAVEEDKLETNQSISGVSLGSNVLTDVGYEDFETDVESQSQSLAPSRVEEKISSIVVEELPSALEPKESSTIQTDEPNSKPEDSVQPSFLSEQEESIQEENEDISGKIVEEYSSVSEASNVADDLLETESSIKPEVLMKKPTELPFSDISSEKLDRGSPPSPKKLDAPEIPSELSGISEVLPPSSKSPEVSSPESPEVSAVKSPEVSPVKSPEVSPVKSPEVSPVKSPEVSPVKSPEVSPVKSPEVPSAKSPERSQAKSPEVSTEKSPEVSPVRSPEVPAVKSPEVSPLKSPEVTAVKSPEVPSAKSPERPPAKSPEVSPVRSPEVPAVKSPEVSPLKSPEVPSAKSPERPPAKSPEVSPVRSPEVPAVKSPEVSAVKSPEVSSKIQSEISEASETISPEGSLLQSQQSQTEEDPEKSEGTNLPKSIQKEVSTQSDSFLEEISKTEEKIEDSLVEKLSRDNFSQSDISVNLPSSDSEVQTSENIFQDQPQTISSIQIKPTHPEPAEGNVRKSPNTTEINQLSENVPAEQAEVAPEDPSQLLKTLTQTVDPDIMDKIESLIASEISKQMEHEDSSESSQATAVEDSRYSSYVSNFHVEDVVYESDFDTDVQSSDRSDKSNKSRHSALLENAVKTEVEIMVQNGDLKIEAQTGEGDFLSRPSTPEDPRIRRILDDKSVLDNLVSRIIARMLKEVSKARNEAFKEEPAPLKELASVVEVAESEGSSVQGEVDADAEWFEDDLMSAGADDESLKREAAEIVAEQLRIENEIRALEALQAQVPATLLNLSDIPDKPPPPYSPPSSDSLSFSVKSFSVQTSLQDLQELIKTRVSQIWPYYSQWNTIPPLEEEEEAEEEEKSSLFITNEPSGDTSQVVQSDKDPSIVSSRAFNTLLQNLIQDTIKELLLIEDSGPTSKDYIDKIRPGSLALEAQKMRVPRSEDQLSSLVFSKVKNLLPFTVLSNHPPAPRKRLTKWTSRPRDLVDEVLAEELIDEDREWTESWPEEILVLDRWAEKFARKALGEVAYAFKTAFT